MDFTEVPQKRFYLHHLMRVELQWPSISQLLLQMFHQPYLVFSQRQPPWCITFEYIRTSKTANTLWLLNGELGEWVRDCIFLIYQGFEWFCLPWHTSSPLRWPCHFWCCFLWLFINIHKMRMKEMPIFPGCTKTALAEHALNVWLLIDHSNQ